MNSGKSLDVHSYINGLTPPLKSIPPWPQTLVILYISKTLYISSDVLNHAVVLNK